MEGSSWHVPDNNLSITRYLNRKGVMDKSIGLNLPHVETDTR